jgi:hypothetical protein
MILKLTTRKNPWYALDKKQGHSLPMEKRTPSPQLGVEPHFLGHTLLVTVPTELFWLMELSTLQAMTISLHACPN